LRSTRFKILNKFNESLELDFFHIVKFKLRFVSSFFVHTAQM